MNFAEEWKNRPQVAKQYLYKLTFPNGMVYIGTAFDVESRWANDGIGYKGQAVWEPIQSFGWANIKREVLAFIPIEENGTSKIRAMEVALIHENDGRCYNRQGTKEFHAECVKKVREKGGYKKVCWEIDGVRKLEKEWCAEYGISLGTVYKRMWRSGLTLKQALSFPPVPKNKARNPIAWWTEQGCFDNENSCRA